jgi:hypothetical protein
LKRPSQPRNPATAIECTCNPATSVSSLRDFSSWAAQLHIYQPANRGLSRDTPILPPPPLQHADCRLPLVPP